MAKENKLTLIDFICNDRFELNSYLSYLFYQLGKSNPDQTEYKMKPSTLL